MASPATAGECRRTTLRDAAVFSLHSRGNLRSRSPRRMGPPVRRAAARTGRGGGQPDGVGAVRIGSAIMTTLEHTVRVPDDVVFRELQGEAVILNLASSMYFGLDA